MRGDLESVESAGLKRSAGRRPRPAFVLIAAFVTVVMSAALCAAAILAPAPAPAVPLVVGISVGCPLFAAWAVPNALSALRRDLAARAGGRALAKLRQSLEQLPETEHPLGL